MNREDPAPGSIAITAFSTCEAVRPAMVARTTAGVTAGWSCRAEIEKAHSTATAISTRVSP